MNTMLSRNAILRVVVVVALTAAVALLARQMRPQPLPTGGQAYFFDLEARRLFIAPEAELPPITSPTGGQAVRAHVYACGDCDDVAAGDVIYLETLTDDARSRLSSSSAAALSPRETAALLDAGLRVAAMPTGDEPAQWVPAAGGQGLRLQSKASTYCSGSPAQLCNP